MSPRNQLTLTVLLLSMELLAGFSVALGSGLLDTAGLSYAVLWLTALVGAVGIAVASAGRTAGLTEPWDQVVPYACGFIAVAAICFILPHALGSVVVGALLLMLAYWRGLALCEERIQIEDVQHRFGVCFAVLFLGIIWLVARGHTTDAPIWHVLAITGIAYTSLALLTLALARREPEPSTGMPVAITVTVQLLVLLVISLASLQFFTLDIASWLGQVTRPFWDVVAVGATMVLRIVLFPVFWTAELLRSHAHHAIRPHPAVPGILPHSQRGPHGAVAGNHPLPAFVGIVFGLFLLSFAAFVAWRLLPRIQRKSEDEAESEPGSAATRRSFWPALLAWFLALFTLGTTATGHRLESTRRRLFGPRYPSDPVRRLYAQMLYRAQMNGVPREATTTPQEFQHLLAQRWPDGADDVAGLTQAYVQRRYAETPIVDEDLERARIQWRRLRLVMRQQPGSGQ